MAKRPPRTPHIRLVKDDPDISNKAARDYLARGFAIIPIPLGSKGPIIKGWQKLVIDESNVDKYFPKGTRVNIGVLLGPRSNDLADVDLDCKEAVVLAPYFLPDTDTIFGRLSKPRSHWLYYIHDAVGYPKNTITITDENKAVIVELRLGAKTAAQTVFPGSQHTSGEEVEWANNGDPSDETLAEVETILKRLGVCSLLLRGWPTVPGTRHSCAFLVGSFLARAGLMLTDIEHMIRAIVTEAGDDDVADRVRCALQSAENFMSGERSTYGLPQLIEQFGEERANHIAKLLDYNTADQEEILERMNEQYCILPLGDNAKMHVMTWRERSGRREAMFYRPDEFKTALNHQKVGKSRMGTWWLAQPQRKQYEGLVFRPGEPSVIDGDLNLWQGWGIQPKEGKWSLMRAHIKNVLAAEDKEMYEYIINWCAWTFQHPGEPAEVALVFQGKEGCGKGIFGRAMKMAFGKHGLHISDHEHLAGKFNKHLMDCALLFCDESWWPGHKAAEGTVKRMLTEPTLLIEPKRVDSFEVHNALHVIMAANAQWVIAASPNARRFAVNAVADTRINDFKYFEALYQEVNVNGIAAMMYDLLRLDLGNWKPRARIPCNLALHEQQMLSLPPFKEFWFGLLQAGAIPALNPQLLTVPSQVLYNLARNNSPLIKNASDERLATWLKEVGCDRQKYGPNIRGFKLPHLKDARTDWCKLFPHVTWENNNEEWEKSEEII